MNEALGSNRLITPDRILDGLRMDIVSQRYKQGERLVEEDISAQYSVSRGSVRTALRELENEGLIRVLPNGRKEVIGFSLKQARDVYDLRFLLERQAVTIALEEDSMNLSPMLDVLRQIEQAKPAETDETDWFALDIQFHQALVMAAQNHPLLMAWKTNIHVMYALMQLNVVQTYEGYREGFYRQHKELFTCIAAKNADVFQILKEHIMSARP